MNVYVDVSDLFDKFDDTDNIHVYRPDANDNPHVCFPSIFMLQVEIFFLIVQTVSHISLHLNLCCGPYVVE